MQFGYIDLWLSQRFNGWQLASGGLLDAINIPLHHQSVSGNGSILIHRLIKNDSPRSRTRHMKARKFHAQRQECRPLGTACILLRLSTMQHSDQLSNWQQKHSIETLFSFHGPGHTMLRSLGANNIPSYEEMLRPTSRHYPNSYDGTKHL